MVTSFMDEPLAKLWANFAHASGGFPSFICWNLRRPGFDGMNPLVSLALRKKSRALITA